MYYFFVCDFYRKICDFNLYEFFFFYWILNVNVWNLYFIYWKFGGSCIFVIFRVLLKREIFLGQLNFFCEFKKFVYNVVVMYFMEKKQYVNGYG